MKKRSLSPSLFLGALGVVYGDIGTSPLYALRETLSGLTVSSRDILGVLSLIVWTLILVVSLKYLVVIFRADNEGEGGILALLALLKQKAQHTSLFYWVAIFGAGLLLGDGMLTPAISVSSAIEGLELISPKFVDVSPGLSAIILLGVFVMQYKGTGRIGAWFGPILMSWFAVIAWLGLVQILHKPTVLIALNPYYAAWFLYENGWAGFWLLGGIFLVVTGGEALYADIGAFGKRAIRCSWSTIVFPALVLNYLGQGAYLMNNPQAITNPFYALSPDWFFLPLMVLATLATIIASQAVISATFSLTRQAILLGLAPRLPVIQTSKTHVGQVYIPQMNKLLLMGSLLLIYFFKNSSGLAHAYGIAVNLNMLMVTLLVSYTAYRIWAWSLVKVVGLFSVFLLIDTAFLGANAHKFITGGWMPTGFAIIIAIVMQTWNSGMRYLKQNFYMRSDDVKEIVEELHYKKIIRLKRLTAIFITDTYDRSGASFLNFLKLSMAVPEHILIVNYVVENKPHVALKNRYELVSVDERILQLTLHYGFMDTISIPKTLKKLNESNLVDYKIDCEHATYLVEVPNIIASKRKRTLLFYWQERLFAFLMRNYSAILNIEFYKIPHNKTIALGTYCII